MSSIAVSPPIIVHWSGLIYSHLFFLRTLRRKATWVSFLIGILFCFEMLSMSEPTILEKFLSSKHYLWPESLHMRLLHSWFTLEPPSTTLCASAAVRCLSGCFNCCYSTLPYSVSELFSLISDSVRDISGIITVSRRRWLGSKKDTLACLLDLALLVLFPTLRIEILCSKSP
jgi:hypothetical protein